MNAINNLCYTGGFKGAFNQVISQSLELMHSPSEIKIFTIVCVHIECEYYCYAIIWILIRYYLRNCEHLMFLLKTRFSKFPSLSTVLFGHLKNGCCARLSSVRVSVCIFPYSPGLQKWHWGIIPWRHGSKTLPYVSYILWDPIKPCNFL